MLALTGPVVDVRGVAEAHVLALIVPQAAGERFIAGGEALSVKDIAGVLKRGFQAYARKLPKFVLPNWLAGLAARVDPGLEPIIPELGRDACGRDRKRAPFAPVPKA